MSALYEDSHRQLQEQFDTQRLADRIEQRLFRAELTEEDRAFIERLDLFFLATVNSRGEPSCSYKGGDPGFVRVLDSRTLAFPCYDGNGMFLSMGNVAANGHVGMLFIDLTSPKRLRVNGTARIVPPESVAPQFAQAQFVVVVAIREVFPNCPRYIHKHTLVERSPFVPREGTVPPVPKWKQMDWARDVLPHNDPATQELPRSGS
ncbi:MAG TPA: pyridoxamine 5'-phosphate oxidase family protein [Gammaproteobacteria bacterium]|nr:pyridoxamine 5'-phosphate oxidase family protein [Gammaproteobacteria bacterium]